MIIGKYFPIASQLAFYREFSTSVIVFKGIENFKEVSKPDIFCGRVCDLQ